MRILIFGFFFICTHSTLYCQTSGVYDITFTSIWNANDHSSLPNGAHWSKLVGVTHKTEHTFFQTGTSASSGIKNIAELGDNNVFISEVNAAITNQEADQYIDGPNLGTATGDILIENVLVSQSYPLLTLVSMVAPSPDWFIGVNSIDLYNGGNWINSITLDLYAMDAGTDDGADYTSSNQVSSPTGNIITITSAPFNGNKIGTITITLKEVLNITDNKLENINLYPNPSRSGTVFIDNVINASIRKIEIQNLSGTKLQTFEISPVQNQFELNVSEYTSGLYLVQLYSELGKVTKKLIIQ